MRRRKRAPWSRHHEDRCAAYLGKPCDCDDDNHRPPEYKYGPLAGGGTPAPERKKERQLDDA
jgi:hypothetical protein